jgi:hypothetical protein
MFMNSILKKSRDFPKIGVHEFNLRVSHIAIAEHLWLQGEPKWLQGESQ